jgi:hypothetical protein
MKLNSISIEGESCFKICVMSLCIFSRVVSKVDMENIVMISYIFRIQ